MRLVNLVPAIRSTRSVMGGLAIVAGVALYGCRDSTSPEPASAPVSGQVFDASGTPVPSITVVAYCGGAVSNAVTNTQGLYLMHVQLGGAFSAPGVNGRCQFFAPDSAHAVARADVTLFFYTPTTNPVVAQGVDLHAIPQS